MKIGEICNETVVWTTRDETVLEAAEMMRENHVGDVVVVKDTDEGRMPIGILTDRDVALCAAEHGPDALTQKTVGDEMSDVLILAREDDSSEEVLGNMASNGVRRVPVVDRHDTLCGILTYDDLVSHFGRQIQKLGEVIDTEINREVTGRS